MNPRVVTPLVAAGAAWGTRRSLNAIYAKRHEGGIPGHNATDVPFRQVLIWALTTALVATLVDVAVQQGMARYANREQHAIGQ